MSRTMRAAKAALMVAMAGGALGLQGASPVEPSHLRALEPLAPALGPGARLVARATVKDASGRLISHFQQFHEGRPVWDAGLWIASAPGQAPRIVRRDLRTGVAVAWDRAQPGARLEAAALKALDPAGPLRVLESEWVVFPTDLQDGLKLKRDAATGSFRWDRLLSVTGRRAVEAYVPARHIIVEAAPGDGDARILHLILDAVTGEPLKAWDDARHFMADQPAVAAQAQGLVHKDVRLDTVLDEDLGGYTLRDTTRGIGIWPKALNPGLGEEVPPALAKPGLQTLYANRPPSNILFMPFVNPLNEWGNGQPLDPSKLTGDQAVDYNTPSGQSAAVDAHWNMATVWDYYKLVHGQDGLDGLGTPVASLVHFTSWIVDPWWSFRGPKWSPYSWSVLYGVADPRGALDLAAHEFAHGDLARLKLELPFEEACADVVATLVKFHAGRLPGVDPSRIPDTAPGADWRIGASVGVDGQPIRDLTRPSLDGFSYDQWFDGIEVDDPHYAAGPIARMFYYLAEGAPADTASPAHSPYLPQGMKGVGKDAVAQLLYALRYATAPGPGAAGFRDWMLGSWASLHLMDPATYPREVGDAIRNAFAAVNIGPSADSQGIVQVTIPRQGDHWYSLVPSAYVIPSMQPTPLRSPVVTGARDSRVTWSLGGLSVPWTKGGRILPGGSFLAPLQQFSFWPVKATSVEDPRRFAVDVVYATSMDCDGDLEFDAIDAGAIALSEGPLNQLPFPGARVAGFNDVSEFDSALFLEGFHNAHPK